MTEIHDSTVTGHSQVHGRPVSWCLVSLVIAALITDGAALIEDMWWLFWVCAGIAVVSVPIGMLIGIMNDTVVESRPAQDPRPVAKDSGSVADPGARI
jgi:hypothetical protein